MTGKAANGKLFYAIYVAPMVLILIVTPGWKALHRIMLVKCVFLSMGLRVPKNLLLTLVFRSIHRDGADESVSFQLLLRKYRNDFE